MKNWTISDKVDQFILWGRDHNVIGIIDKLTDGKYRVDAYRNKGFHLIDIYNTLESAMSVLLAVEKQQL